MQMQIFLFIIPLVLFSACDRKERNAVPPIQVPPTASAPKAAETQSRVQTSRQPQMSELDIHPASAAAPDPEKLALGEKVYKGTCSICHKTGLNGAPRMGSKKDWEQRLAQGNDVLYSHAINGYRGSKGSMPSRGSNPKLSEAEVKAAVDYIVEHSIPSWSVE